MFDFIKANVRSTILVAFGALAVIELILPTFYDFATSCIEIAVLYFVLYKTGLFEPKKQNSNNNPE
jgi:hypothetical protein